ncbi:hypothetical protein AMECASPLE_016512 [Ameca splendens]|uniref:Uncharacterized protein n=1 Tax=Ameca splendens TaxID=208324 RepID=A0ABV0Z1P8_9TELE
MGANNSTRRVSFESDENHNITVVKGIRLSENVIKRMKEPTAPTSPTLKAPTLTPSSLPRPVPPLVDLATSLPPPLPFVEPVASRAPSPPPKPPTEQPTAESLSPAPVPEPAVVPQSSPVSPPAAPPADNLFQTSDIPGSVQDAEGNTSWRRGFKASCVVLHNRE